MNKVGQLTTSFVDRSNHSHPYGQRRALKHQNVMPCRRTDVVSDAFSECLPSNNNAGIILQGGL